MLIMMPKDCKRIWRKFMRREWQSRRRNKMKSEKKDRLKNKERNKGIEIKNNGSSQEDSAQMMLNMTMRKMNKTTTSNLKQ